MLNDEYSLLLGDANARVACGVTAKVAGPHSSYSSIQVHATVSLNCNQDTRTVAKAMDLATADAMRAVDEAIRPAQEMLQNMLSRSG